MNTITLVNKKGSSGKTISALSLTSTFSIAKKKVLLVDLDPECLATLSLGKESSCDLSFNRMARNSFYLEKIIIPVKPWIYLVPGNKELFNIKTELLQSPVPREVLRNSLQPIENRFDYCIIDTAPTCNLCLENAVLAANLVVIPVSPDYFSDENIQHMFTFLSPLVKETTNCKLLYTNYDCQSELAAKALKSLLKKYKNRNFKTIIPKDSLLEHGIYKNLYTNGKRNNMEPTISWDALYGRGYYAFVNLSKEIINYEKG